MTWWVVELWRHPNGWAFAGRRSGTYSTKQLADEVCAKFNRTYPKNHFEVWDQETVDRVLIERELLTKGGSET